MRVFFQWYAGPLEKLRGKPSRRPCSQWRTFLVLDTFGGRSYLLRRDSRIRLLSSYYCILVLDRSNDQKMIPTHRHPAADRGHRQDIRSHTGPGLPKAIPGGAGATGPQVSRLRTPQGRPMRMGMP